MRLLLLGVVWMIAAMAQAHPLAPALLELREAAPDRYEVRWRTSVARVQAIEVVPRWPQGCALVAPLITDVSADGEALESRGQLACAVLTGREVGVEGLDRAGIAVIVRIESASGSVQQTLLDARAPSWRVPPPESATEVVADYLVLGIEHLILGLDHVLFVLGLTVLVRGWQRLLATLTAFTMGHSLTLAAASLGWIEVDSRITELGIAASLLWLACEIARGQGRGVFARFPFVLAGLFGLVHGLGFAGVLAERGLPVGEIPLALFAFNTGIELGQVALVLPFLVLLRVLGQDRIRGTMLLAARQLPAYAIGVLAAYWCFERGAAWWV